MLQCLVLELHPRAAVLLESCSASSLAATSPQELGWCKGKALMCSWHTVSLANSAGSLTQDSLQVERIPYCWREVSCCGD